ncbi:MULTISPECIES: heavy metal translocating P-type ATPase [unclassified Streptomyces]|uniref:heavy metal translocating P-type ATPase n=1 Tax=unclassified Streptomyces TaxID=2593676 RepID=UPI0013A6F0FD|nr:MULTISPECIES: heavy metal translocating P-type ATPase [unclassified Streptomyces]QZZ31148.1 heavy metal translocating P-type ATPase [Streptomyces sp. ST1015]
MCSCKVGRVSATLAPVRPAAVPRRRTRLLALPEVRWALAATVFFAFALAVDLGGGPGWLYGPLYAVSYVCGGWEPALEGLRALREKTLDVDLLMIVAAIGAASIGQVLDGALLIVIFATSGALEALATARTADSVRGLLDLAPETATRVTDAGESVVPAAELAVGDVLLVRPGERIAGDGRVVDGVSEVDQATVTGESLPVVKRTGDEVYAGTLNGTGALRVRVERDPADSVIARIVGLVEEASRTKAPTQVLIEKVEQRYAVGVVVATLAVFAVPLAFGADLTSALLRAMTFMIVASPCAVVLATMPPLLSAVANAGRHGVLVKSAVAMEQLGAVQTVALDKTGTLTEGVPEVSGVRALPGSGLDEDGVLALAAAAEHASEHPLGRAIVAEAGARGIEAARAENFVARPGWGVEAVVEGRTVTVGRVPAEYGDGVPAGREAEGDAGAAGRTPQAGAAVVRQVSEGRAVTAGRDAEVGSVAAGRGPGDGGGSRTALAEAAVRFARQHGENGCTTVLVTRDGVPVGTLDLTDRLRPEAPAAVAALTALTGSAPVLLTGDQPEAAARVAEAAGITDVRAGLLPEEKVAAVQGLGTRVLFVGDGVNDAPALAVAHAGVAMGHAGSDLALETADAVLVHDDLSAVPAAVRLSRTARRLVRQNLVIAGVFITGLVLWDLVGHLPLPLGVAGHEGSTVLVGLNGLRLLRESAWRA